ncbi:glutathione S-transferase [Cypionkella aquatica]|uniref:Glutathione S-transferase n=1 Tax=Cypionkella aquatica TaxID=1756042 RepID=A0AA37U2J4_9RHOB|nr:glutathione S-transferase N-terminal domain-containing protein [Cypionkella aquatica]GLS85121.1 glutathione S-transferase [Cypionkella aquatica]
MILIGQYDSPFVRRVGIALTLYGMAFEHRPWSSFGDADRLRHYNPLTRVPTLVLDDGFVLTDSHMMLDYLDHLVDAPLFPRAEPDRHRVMKVAALGCGLADKAVSLFYERALHATVSASFEARCRNQISAVLIALEADLASRPGPTWFGTLSHADIAVACAWRFVAEVHGALIGLADYPSLQRLTDTLEATPAFQTIYQRFQPPA